MIEIPLTRGYVAIVDDIDADLLQYHWSALVQKTNVYAQRGERTGDKTKIILMHRVILERKLGIPLTKQNRVDHIHNNGLDNRRCELRLATISQNMHNRGISRRNTTGYKGVTYESKRGKWCAKIGYTIDGKRHGQHLGYFLTPNEAHAAYCAAAIKYHGEFANFGTTKPATIIQLPLFDLDKVA